MATIKDWLDEAGFDWVSGRVIYHPCLEDQEEDGHCYRGWASDYELGKPEEITGPHPALLIEFPTGHGAPMCPRFIAEDKDKLYFHGQYDGATWCEVVWKDISKYLEVKIKKDREMPMEMTPYPGG